MGRRRKSQSESPSSVPEAPQDAKDSELDAKLTNLEEEYKAEKPAKKPRKKKEEVLREENFSQSAVLVGSLALDIIVRRLPNPIPLTEFEKTAFDKTFSDLVKKYFQYVSRFGEELAFILVAVTVLAPRLPKKKVPTKTEEEHGTTNNVVVRKDGNGENVFSEKVDTERAKIGGS